MPNDLTSHYQILVRTGSISLVSGIIGGSISYFMNRQSGITTKKGRFALYISKIGTGFFAAYLSVLTIGVFSIPATPETEQAISILAAILGSDFIALLSKRIFGRGIDFDRDRDESDYQHKRDNEQKDRDIVQKNDKYRQWLE